MTKCSHCGSKRFNKDGRAAGKQRYRCKECAKTFGGGVYAPEQKAQALQYYMNNVGIRKIAFFNNVSHPVVLSWIKTAHKNLGLKIARQIKSANATPDIIEMDEIYTYVKKNCKEQSYGLLTVGGRAVLLHLK
jgi:transposase-like protein